MQHKLPKILTCGLFDSKNSFQNISVTAPRKISCYELEYYGEDGDISVVNGNEYHRKRGSILFAKPGDCRYSHLSFTCKFIRFVTNDDILISKFNNISSFFYTGNAKKNVELFDDIFEYFYSENPFDKLVANAKLLLLLHYLCNEQIEEQSIVSKCQQFIKTNYSENIDTGSIAIACNVSVSYLHKLFKAELGMTPGEYLLNCRISAAKDMLINTSLPLNDIASACGFHSQSYFSDCFKRKCGVSPSYFKKNTSYLL